MTSSRSSSANQLFWYSYLCAREGVKIEETLGLDGPKTVENLTQNRPKSRFGGLGVAWGVFGEIWARISRKIVAQVRPRQGKGAVSWSKSSPSWPMLALRWRLGAQLGGFGVDFGSIW